LEHPAFQEDPFEAMQEHLRNTLAQEKEQMQVQGRKTKTRAAEEGKER
jgi:hypothetical protein